MWSECDECRQSLSISTIKTTSDNRTIIKTLAGSEPIALTHGAGWHTRCMKYDVFDETTKCIKGGYMNMLRYDEEIEVDCPICYESLTKILVQLPCRHFICLDCLSILLKAPLENVCGLCKKPVHNMIPCCPIRIQTEQSQAPLLPTRQCSSIIIQRSITNAIQTPDQQTDTRDMFCKNLSRFITGLKQPNGMNSLTTDIIHENCATGDVIKCNDKIVMNCITQLLRGDKKYCYNDLVVGIFSPSFTGIKWLNYKQTLFQDEYITIQHSGDKPENGTLMQNVYIEAKDHAFKIKIMDQPSIDSKFITSRVDNTIKRSMPTQIVQYCEESKHTMYEQFDKIATENECQSKYTVIFAQTLFVQEESGTNPLRTLRQLSPDIEPSCAICVVNIKGEAISLSAPWKNDLSPMTFWNLVQIQ